MLDIDELLRRRELNRQGRWEVPDNLDTSDFNFDWRPDPYDRPYIHIFGTQWQRSGGPRFVVPEAEGHKFQDSQCVRHLPRPENFQVHIPNYVIDFDWSWHPDEFEPAQTYVWGNQFFGASEMPTVEYVASGGSNRKFMNDQLARLRANPECWRVQHAIDHASFDWDWMPDIHEPEPYIYVWGNQWWGPEVMPTVEYHVPGAVTRKYMHQGAPRLLPRPELPEWKLLRDIDAARFDWSWVPDPNDPAYIYVWGNQFLTAEQMPTVEYHVPGATERKYVRDFTAYLQPDASCWRTLQPIDREKFDWTWCPHPYDPPYIYVWGNQFLTAEQMPTVEYHVPGATERKYQHEQQAVLVSDPAAWHVLHPIDRTQFDWNWQPHPWEPAYIYTWGNRLYSAEHMPTVEYHVPGATERKYMYDQVALVQNDRRCWHILHPVDRSAFDWDWYPPAYEQPWIWVWGNQHHGAERMPTVEYRVPGATQRKYIHDSVAQLEPQMPNWKRLVPNVEFDWSWVPDPHEPAYIYVWGNQHYGVDVMPTLEYHMPGATERKYIRDQVATLTDNPDCWTKLLPNVEFDWSWCPDPREPAYIYVWGNQHYDCALMPTLEYHAPGATERKYITDTVATLTPDMTHWRQPAGAADFDYSWTPHPHDPPYIYVWGNQHHDAVIMPTAEYHTPGATERKYMHTARAILQPAPELFNILVAGAVFDWSWRPSPAEPAYIYVWGNQWHDATTEPTVEYRVPGATERKYMTDAVATVPADYANWSVANQDDWNTFDFSWRPNPHSPPQIYQWANNGPRYTVPGATAVVLMTEFLAPTASQIKRYYITSSLEDLIAQHPEEVFWALRSYIDYSDFDFGWRPDDTNFRHINVFGNKLSRDTQTYFVNGPMYQLGHRHLNYITELELSEHQDLALEQRVILDMFYIDMNNHGSDQRYQELQARFPHIQRTRFLVSWRDTVLRCTRKAQSRFIWVLNSRTDYSKFDFDWYPADWQQSMLHIFGSQWSHWSNTYLVNAETYEHDVQYIDTIEHLSNINHVRGRVLPVLDCAHDILYINMGNAGQLEQLRRVSRNVHVVDYQGSYLDTIKHWLATNPTLSLKRDYSVWITNSVADYTDFDWSWYPDPFQRNQIHVFAAGTHNLKQKFGDTLFANVSELIKVLDELDQIENYTGKVHYISHMPVPRLPHPVIQHEHDTQAQAFAQQPSDDWPYYELRTADSPDSQAPVASVWGQNHEKIIVGSTGASQIIVPRSAWNKIKSEVYDYDQIETAERLAASHPLDIIFISNGEPIADSNYEHLVEICRGRGVPNKIHRVSGVDGRVASQHAAAHKAGSGWYFLVNGKLRVSETFDWSWQPDRLQKPKHYIFTATNPVNSLEYGHQAIVANNRELTLNTVVNGLDFTLSSLHESVDINCGVALYNTDAWTTWRTAFREAIKLRANTDDVSKYRLKVWTTLADGDFAQDSLQGARDGVAYYESVSGDLDRLMLSYDWAWIRQYYQSKYGT